MKRGLQINTGLANATHMVRLIKTGVWLPELQGFDMRVEDWGGACHAFLIGHHENLTVIVDVSDWSYKFYIENIR